MIEFRQKIFSEYDAMRSLYVELLKRGDRNKWKVIDSGSLIPILRGNSVVIERFVISTSLFGSDKYRMYLKVGAKAKMPDEVRLPSRYYDKRLGNASININLDTFPGNEKKEKTFGKGGGGPKPIVQGNISPSLDFSYQVKELLGNAVKYDKKARSVVLEFSSIGNAIEALNILPFGINYNIYLLS